MLSHVQFSNDSVSTGSVETVQEVKAIVGWCCFLSRVVCAGCVVCVGCVGCVLGVLCWVCCVGCVCTRATLMRSTFMTLSERIE